MNIPLIIKKSGLGIVPLLLITLVLSACDAIQANSSPTPQAAVSTATTAAATTAAPVTTVATTAAATTAAPVTTIATTAAPVTTVATSAATAAPASTTGTPQVFSSVCKGLASTCTPGTGTTVAGTTVGSTTAAVPRTTVPGTTVAKTAANSIEVPNGFQLYRNTDTDQLNLEVAYPASWKANFTRPSQNRFQLYLGSADNKLGMAIERINSSNNLSVDQYNAVIIQSFEKEGYKQPDPTSRFWAFGGEKWLSSTFVKDDIAILSFVALHNGLTYSVAISGDSKYNGSEPTNILNTLHFLDSLVSGFVGEVKGFTDPKKKYTINYPVNGGWAIDTSGSNPLLINKDKNISVSVLEPLFNTSSLNDYLPQFIQIQATQNKYTATQRSIVFNPGKNLQEQWVDFSPPAPNNKRIVRGIIQKDQTNFNIGFIGADNTGDIEKTYTTIWRYVEFIK